jgi:hypothetical protein
MDLFPSTMERPQTVFTFSVLDRYRIESLEGKTSAYSFYSQLRRLTDNCFPHLLPVCPCPILSSFFMTHENHSIVGSLQRTDACL